MLNVKSHMYCQWMMNTCAELNVHWRLPKIQGGRKSFRQHVPLTVRPAHMAEYIGHAFRRHLPSGRTVMIRRLGGTVLWNLEINAGLKKCVFLDSVGCKRVELKCFPKYLQRWCYRPNITGCCDSICRMMTDDLSQWLKSLKLTVSQSWKKSW